jgi:hypothetical protein
VSHPRPDQQHLHGLLSSPGSRSGAGETAGALGYPGVPPAVPNLLGATLFQQPVSTPTIVSVAGPGRIWAVLLSYAITSNASFALSTVRTVASVQMMSGPLNLTLAVVQLGVANPNQHAEGSMSVAYNGVPAITGTTLQLNVNNGAVITNLDQQASVSVLYSIP